MENKNKVEIPERFLEDCMIVDSQRAKDADEITEDLVLEVPDCGERINSAIFSAVKGVVEAYIMPEVEKYAETYFEPSARDEAMEDIRRETMEHLRSDQ